MWVVQQQEKAMMVINETTLIKLYLTLKLLRKYATRNEAKMNLALQYYTRGHSLRTSKLRRSRILLITPFDMILLDGSKAMPIIRAIMSTQNHPISIAINIYIKRWQIGLLIYMLLKLYRLVQKPRRYASPFETR